MQRGLPLDALDSRHVFLGYTAIVGPLGVFVALWGSIWMGGPLNGQPWGVNSITRLFGVAIVAAAAFAYASSTVGNPVDRRRLLGWFVVVHIGVMLTAWTQVYGVWGAAIPAPALWLFVGVAAATIGLLAGFLAHGGDPAPLGVYMGLFGTVPPEASSLLRSKYEEQIREIGAQEERNRLARDLHDSIKQQIFAIQTSAATADTRLLTDPAGARDAIAQVRIAARDSMAEMDALLDQLHLPAIENTGLVEALRVQTEALQLRTGATVTFTVGSLPPAGSLPPGAHRGLLRIAQEALSNVARHARASRVTMALECKGDALTLTIADNGTGFVGDGTAPGMGLSNIRARAAEYGGEVHIGSHPGEGTTIFVALPLTVADPAYYLRRVMWTAAAFAAFMALFLERWWAGRGHFIGIMLVPMLLHGIRYFIAWRRAKRLRAEAA
jgi:signal transduction histidine kinase